MIDRTNHPDLVIVSVFNRRFEVNLRVINRWLIAATVFVAIAYAIFFVAAWFFGNAAGDHARSIMPGNPRLVIVLCLITAALTSLYLGDLGKIISASLFGGLMLFFLHWWNVTSGIRGNLETETLPNSGWLQTYLIGASWVDVSILFAAVIFFLLDVWTVAKNFQWRPSKNRRPSLSS